MRRGFVLVEVSIAYLVLSLAVVALVPVFILALRANKSAERLQAAAYLSAELLDEVRLRRWDEQATAAQPHVFAPSAIGRDAGESATDKRGYDDIDDFDGWTESGVLDPMMRAVSGLSDYRRTVAVSYVDADLNASGPATNLKKVVVCTKTPSMSPICLQTLVGNH